MLVNDDRAWRWFTRRYERLLFAAIHKVLAPFSRGPRPVEPEEVYAALMSSLVDRDMFKLRAFEFERGHKLSTWLVMLATHAAWDHVRASSRHRLLLSEIGRGEPPHSDLDALGVLNARESFCRLVRVCAALRPRDKQFFDLLYVRCASPEEIAAEMGISVKTVYTKKHKVLARLESAL
jgi:RNA polymerase sigma-70 factor (ECF subfamily)